MLQAHVSPSVELLWCLAGLAADDDVDVRHGMSLAARIGRRANRLGTGMRCEGLRDGLLERELRLSHGPVLALCRLKVVAALDLLGLRDGPGLVVHDDLEVLPILLRVDGELQLPILDLELRRQRASRSLRSGQP